MPMPDWPRVIVENWNLLAFLAAAQVGFAVLVNWCLKDLDLEDETRLALGFSGGLLLLSLVCLLFAWAKTPASPWVELLACFAIAAGLFFRKYSFARLPAYNFSTGGLILFLLLLLWFRLVFTLDMLVPPYADSVQHVLVVQDILNPHAPRQAFFQFALDSRTYYHFGFHALAAWLVSVSGTTVSKAILFLGQYFQAMAIFAFYPMARLLTRSKLGAWGVLLIAGLILPLPAYASNWGKYPAIASLVGIGFCCGVAGEIMKSRSRLLPAVVLVLGLGGLATFFLHSRVAPLFLFAWLVTLLLKELSPIPSSINDEFFVLALSVSILLALESVLLARDFSSIPSHWLLVICLAVLGFTLVGFYRDYFVMIRLSLFLILTGVLGQIPFMLDFLPDRYSVLIDAVYQKIVFSILLAVLAWLGLDGMVQMINGKKKLIPTNTAFGLVLLFSVLVGLQGYNLRPAACCIYFDDNDLFAFEWIKTGIPAGGLVGIAATGEAGSYLAADGGAWIEYFTGVPTRKVAYNTNFERDLPDLCAKGVQYYYVDTLENSFDEYDLAQAGAGFVFGLGNVRIYSADCSQFSPAEPPDTGLLLHFSHDKYA
jgi:hypothetical protein